MLEQPHRIRYHFGYPAGTLGRRRVLGGNAMTGSQQREWVTGILESLPSVTFLALWRGDLVGLEAAGWTGCGLAAAVLLALRLRRTPFDPILLGINLHMLVITPLVVGLFHAGQPALAGTLVDTAQTGVLVAILAVGAALTLFAPRGFVGIAGLPTGARRGYSLLLLAVAGAAVPWSLAHAGSALMSIGVPLMALFGLRRYLVARWQDKAGDGDRALAAMAAPGGD